MPLDYAGVKCSKYIKRSQGPSNTCINGFHKYTSPKFTPMILEYGGMQTLKSLDL